MTPLYPLRFEPIYRRYIWGGRRLNTVLGKPLPTAENYAESWEICDRRDDQSVVRAGPLTGRTLAELVATRGAELLGRHAPQPRFPLLFKFLDACQPLSLQVHPTDEQIARVDPTECGKTEAWVVLDAQPGSVVWAGIKRGFDRAAVEREVSRGTCDLCLHRYEPRAGDCLFLPAGTLHALGAGLLVAEVQQPSDCTYRLYDWDRSAADGTRRPLHVDAALATIDFNRGPVLPQSPQLTSEPHIARLVACDKFVLDRWSLGAPASIGGDDCCRIVAVLEGSVKIAGDAATGQLAKGDVVLFPASLARQQLVPSPAAVLLCANLP